MNSSYRPLNPLSSSEVQGRIFHTGKNDTAKYGDWCMTDEFLCDVVSEQAMKETQSSCMGNPSHSKRGEILSPVRTVSGQVVYVKKAVAQALIAAEQERLWKEQLKTAYR